MVRIFFHNTPANKYSINALSYVIEDIENISVRYFYNTDEIKNSVNENDKNIFIFSFMTPFFEKEVIMANTLKKIFPFIITCAGGAHINEKNVLNLINDFDYIFIGEGEKIFRDFIKSMSSGAGFLEKIIRNTGFINIDSYMSISNKYKRFGAIEITRGCPYKCFYCANSFNMGYKVRHKSIENILREIDILLKNNFYDIRFISPDLASYGSEDGKEINIDAFKKFVEEINKMVKDKGRVFIGSFPSEIRPEHITPDILKILKGKTSSKRIAIGAQSGSEEILKKINRQHSVLDVIKAVELLDGYGFDVDVDFIFGFPFETDRDLDDTKKLIDFLTENYNVRIHLHYFIPLPNTPFENLKPRRVDSRTRRFLSSLTSRKIAFGQWENQVRLGFKD